MLGIFARLHCSINFGVIHSRMGMFNAELCAFTVGETAWQIVSGSSHYAYRYMKALITARSKSKIIDGIDGKH